ncbi:uncharacterized protein RHO25_011599 [Cercospora beticola]|uniref:CBF1-interacting co-repressor CIR N-terminal domain-containing protein n=1 Tax=Cercospora beticola TaxID=122368 RepID=A0ABZ0P501_CERBT|nr:hypothetical protein RHO25_011599 [Cercospora beticola]
MPLHLLGKKSWNVYNTANISRVRKDEAEAQVREEAAEQRMQEEDAARRIAILRGEAVPEIPAVEDEEQQSSDRRREKNFGEDETYVSRDRKRKRRRGEDDTERDMRYAIENRERGERARETLLQGQKSTTVRDSSAAEAPLQDHTGHIQLFAPPDEKQIRSKQKNAEAEAEKAKKRKREEDLGTMKFSNAAGYNNGMQKPWYAATDNAPRQSTDTSASRNEIMLAELKGKDVWGNEDSRRKERETKRIVSSDPFAMMQSAQKQLKQSERDKEEWERRRRKELEDLKREQQRKKRRGEIDKDSLDGFSVGIDIIIITGDTEVGRETGKKETVGDIVVGRENVIVIVIVSSEGIGRRSVKKDIAEAIVTDIENKRRKARGKCAHQRHSTLTDRALIYHHTREASPLT